MRSRKTCLPRRSNLRQTHLPLISRLRRVHPSRPALLKRFFRHAHMLRLYLPPMADLNEILDAANKLGDMVASHPAVQKYKDAQKAVSADPEAGRLLADFEKELVSLSRQEQSGIPVTDAQQQKLHAIQSRIVSNLRIKALNLAEVEFYDLLRKVNQAVLRQVAPPQPGGSPATGPRVMGM